MTGSERMRLTRERRRRAKLTVTEPQIDARGLG
jgi:hypothetical protein